MTSIGIIGAGNIGRAFATALARHNIAATLSNSRGPESLSDIVAAIGPSITAGTREEAAAKDIVLVAVHWANLSDALAGLPGFDGRIVIDANNPVEIPAYRPVDLNGKASSEAFTELVPGARVVKAFNHLPAKLLSEDPQAEGGNRVLFYSGDDATAKVEIGTLIEQLGFFGIDLGSLAVGSRFHEFPGGPLMVHDLVKFG